ncbi:hypothetical protein TAO_0452 [Candidatus Nitrosoglobus terrae]|uniref:Uncharacterized protein n=1 Tax=Candidatus Nitrosoglobus terrae TaxID=1630141 RepID=A0A1Q2SL35_9GAMM|nr:hypothetical protein TAO_0452 [Candidatus Nitrosoglobus terrae]
MNSLLNLFETRVQSRLDDDRRVVKVTKALKTIEYRGRSLNLSTLKKPTFNLFKV